MKVHNVRLGFATNSSSTHSIIFLKPGQTVADSDVEAREFGWDHWTAASSSAKRQYVAFHLYQALTSQVNKEIASAVVDAWVKGVEKTSDQAGETGELSGYVDHQSVMILPNSWDGKGVDKAFFEEFAKFFMRDDVVLLGGNDNTDEAHSLADAGRGPAFHLPLPRDGTGGHLVARKDERGDYWTVFDRHNGSKVRFSFANPTVAKEVVKASVPELIDVKITDFCPFGCSFCYQGSTHAGKHASDQTLGSLAYQLGQMKVFEVAIGGGEPTMHPGFVTLLTSLRLYGVIPNFTTKSLAWLRDASLWPKVVEAAGGFAYSADKAEDVKKLATLLEVNGIDRDKANIQHVMGTSNVYEFEQIIRTAAERHLRITLLGYKTTGRGSSFKPQDYKGWIDVVKKLHKDKVYFNLGIDTLLAQESLASLKKANIHPALYETQEGRFSMYIDAVEMKLGPSSFVEDIAMKRVKDLGEKTILSAFDTYGKTSWQKVDTLDA